MENSKAVQDMLTTMDSSSKFARLTKDTLPILKYFLESSQIDREWIEVFSTRNQYNAATAALKNQITDVIYLENSDIMRLFKPVIDLEKVKKDKEQVKLLPDIIFANTVPLKNFRVIMNMNNTIYDEIIYTFQSYDMCPISSTPKFSEGDDINEFFDRIKGSKNVVIPFAQISEFYQNSKEDFSFIVTDVALMTIKFKWTEHGRPFEMSLKIPITITSNDITPSRYILEWKGQGTDVLKKYEIPGTGMIDIGSRDIGYTTRGHIEFGVLVYYAINVLLLNPVIKEVFYENSTEETVTTGQPAGKTKKAPIRYIKRHKINSDNIYSGFSKQGFVRRAMIWYVTGHWREYKSGKRIFIQGYWKGALRNARNSAFPNLEPREREIVTDEIK